MQTGFISVALSLITASHGALLWHVLNIRKDHKTMASTIDDILSVIDEVKTGVAAVGTAVPAVPEGYVQVAQSDLDKIHAAITEIKPLVDAIAPAVKKDGIVGAIVHEAESFVGKA